MVLPFASLDPLSSATEGADPITMAEPMLDGLRREWQRLGRAGTWWTGAERVAIAQVARKALAGQDTTNSMLPQPATQAAGRVASDATSINPGTLRQFEADGLSPAAYTEIVGVVARLVAVDTTVRGAGAPEEPLPAPSPGEPSGLTPEEARKRSAWVPMVGAAGAVTALTGVSAEAEAQEDLHGALYLTYEEMGDSTVIKGLSRAQLELVASKTSMLNECVY